MKVWFNGEILDYEEVKLPIDTHALHYGSSVFEGIRAYETEKGVAIFRLKEHVDRFFYSMEQLRMLDKVVFSKEKIFNAIKEIVKVNNLRDCYIRPIAFYSTGGLGLDIKKNKVNIAIFAFPFNYLEKETIKVKISSFKRINNKTTNVFAKIGGNYINSIFAHIEALEMGFDEALLLDENNYIAEGSGENVFFIKENTIYTPLINNILPGITRDSVIKIAKDLGFKVIEKNIDVSELKYYEEAFFTGTAAEIKKIGVIDEIVFEQFEKTQLIKEKFDLIKRGKDKKYLNWLTFIDDEIEKEKEILF